MLEMIDHIGIVTPDLETGSIPYQRMGLTPLGADEENSVFASKLRVFQVGESLIKLVAPTSPDSPLEPSRN
jgi:methylmalonyl-CoA/ethylmalonyl-CoA epimerase